MSFFSNLAHQISANATDARRHSSLVSVVHAEDVDQLVEKVRGYRIAFTQIDKGPFAAELVQTELAGVLLTAAQYGRSLIHWIKLSWIVSAYDRATRFVGSA
ncbi:hypothetical protein [Bradyrhizobium sp. Ai1a-2]|uniref:hypothetical protein n=1 Tax=Bradyrhizobium sp. Ai1a-2 TaxID=196490 RepID=UPI000489706D|nr:hypothetical protein [Bradyrhizobium sp. Ai1a-2]